MFRKIVFKVLKLTIAGALVFSGMILVNADNTSAPQGNLNKGVIMLTPSGGRGFERFYPTLRDRIIQDHAFFPFGWATVEKEEGVYDWSELDALVDVTKEQGKSFVTALWTAAHDFTQTPQWLYYDYNVRRITAQGSFVNFEDESKYRGFEILQGGNITSDPNHVIAQEKSLVGTSGPFLSAKNAEILTSFDQSLGFDYSVIEDGVFSIQIEYENGEVKTIWEKDMADGESGSYMIHIPKEELTGLEDLIWTAHEGTIVVDNVAIAAEIPGEHGIPVAYPNYFDPVFKDKYEAFVEALYERYKDEPTMAAIYVGGYGRWDEVSLGADPPDPHGYNPYATVDNYFMTDEQFISYGYTDDEYIDHIKWCGQLFEDYFGESDKDIIMQSIAYDVPGDTAYVNWQIINYAASMGFGLKVNGLTERMTEFGVDANQYSWMANRHKYSDLLFYLEQATQVNNIDSNLVGHPLSLINRIIIDSIDYCWFYDNDLTDPYVRKYLHLYNEQAGSALVNKMYSVMGAFPYYSNHARRSFTHYNLWTGIFTTNSENLEFSELDGVKYAQTTSRTPSILISIDDRQKWSGMYGNTLTIDYYDDEGSFEVIGFHTDDIRLRGSPKVLGEVEMTGTKEWKSVSFYDSSYTNNRRSGGRDMPVEIEIKSLEDSTVKISHIELNYVPVWEYERYHIRDKGFDPENRYKLNEDPIILEIDVVNGKRIAEIAIPVSQESKTTVNVSGEVYAVNEDNEKQLVTIKDLYMPGSLYYFPFPVSNALDDTVGFELKLWASSGEAFAYSDENGEIVYRTSGFVFDEPHPYEVVKVSSGENRIEALKDFGGIEIQGNGTVGLSFSKKLPDGQWVELFETDISLDENTRWEFEPQTSGIYSLKVSGDKNYTVNPLPLKRIDPPKEPLRYNLGVDVNREFRDSGDLWKPVSGLKEISHKDGIFSALLDGVNPAIETSREISFDAERIQIFHFIMKNETSSPLTKLYWKTQKEDFYCETKSALIPTVANDDQFREYSWPIGRENGWNGTITGLKFKPVTGHTSTGKISIYSLSVKDDNIINYDFREPLDLGNIDPIATVFVEKGQNPLIIAILSVIAGLAVVIAAGVFIKKKKK